MEISILDFINSSSNLQIYDEFSNSAQYTMILKYIIYHEMFECHYSFKENKKNLLLLNF